MEQPTERRVRKVSVNEFIPLLEMVESGKCVLIDVRSPDEFRNEKVEGAKNVPVDTIKNSMDDIDRDIALLIYCKTGNRSLRAVEQLLQMGFKDVMMLDGGINAWKAHCRK
ncbi:MAG: rhodanese-like domain-containing protein [Methanomassiliicoccales archaeon]|nr:rhodanese-like domain-containing protein [Methanomassiliicoccales archaeon]